MRALTLWQPWAHAICYHGKRIENRPCRPPNHRMGRTFAIHAGLRWDPQFGEVAELEDFPRGYMGTVARRDCVFGAVVATAFLYAASNREDELRYYCGDDQVEKWWCPGQYGLVLKRVRRVTTPIPVRGAQGFWRLPPLVAQLVRDNTLAF